MSAVAQDEGDPRAGEVIGLGQGVKLHAHLLGAGDGQEGASLPPVEDDLGVGVVVEDHDVIFLSEGHQLLVEGLGRRHRDGVHGVGDHHHLRLSGHGRVDGGEVGEVVILRQKRIADGFRAAEHGSHLEDGVARIRHQHHVAGVADRPADVGDALLGAVDGHDLIPGKLHLVAAAVPVLHRLQ